MKRPLTSIITGFVYIITAAFIVGAFTVVLVQNANLQGDYNHLFSQYSKSVGDCTRASDCKSTVPPPSVIKGAAGANGLNGANGSNGANATDGQVFTAVTNYCALRGECQGPTGVAGQSGTAGVNGTNGADGAPGPQGPAGADGAAGQPPTGWTYTDDLGMTHTCTRATPFDPTNPQYTCN